MGKPRRLEMTGDLVIWDQEGGYADASARIDQKSVTEALCALCVEQWSQPEKHTGPLPAPSRYFTGEWKGGRVRLVVEFEDE